MRLVTLDWHLRGTLPDDLDPTRLHLRGDLRPAIEGSMAALDELLGPTSGAEAGSRAAR